MCFACEAGGAFMVLSLAEPLALRLAAAMASAATPALFSWAVPLALNEAAAFASAAAAPASAIAQSVDCAWEVC